MTNHSQGYYEDAGSYIGPEISKFKPDDIAETGRRKRNHLPSKYKSHKYPKPKFIDKIKEKFDKFHPDAKVTEFLIKKSIEFFWESIEDIIEDEFKEDTSSDKAIEIPITRFGKFIVKKGASRRKTKTKDEIQLFIRFKFSHNLISRLRFKSKTMNETELKNYVQRKDSVTRLWEKRKQSLISKSEEINLHPAHQRRFHHGAEINKQFENNLAELEKLLNIKIDRDL